MKKIIFILTIVVGIIIINNLGHSIYDLWQKRDLVGNAERELAHRKQENQKLKSDLSYAESKEFVEKEARNKLLWVKPGEEEVLIGKNLIEANNSEKKAQSNDPNWKKWLELFF